jgi:hypothetical protein
MILEFVLVAHWFSNPALNFRFSNHSGPFCFVGGNVRQNGAIVNRENAKDFRPFCFSAKCLEKRTVIDNWRRRAKFAN